MAVSETQPVKLSTLSHILKQAESTSSFNVELRIGELLRPEFIDNTVIE